MTVQDVLMRDLLINVRQSARILRDIDLQNRRKLVALEGIDGSGKATQASLIELEARRNDMWPITISFPRYEDTDNIFSFMIGQYLRGEFGDATELDPRIAALLYAGDRLETLKWINTATQEYDLVIFDRYSASNAAFQAAKVAPEHRPAFYEWVSDLEYSIYGLPMPYTTIWLDVPLPIAQQNVLKKKKRSYTDLSEDQHERNRDFMEHVLDCYSELYDEEWYSNWFKVNCANESGMREPEEILQDIWAIIKR